AWRPSLSAPAASSRSCTSSACAPSSPRAGPSLRRSFSPPSAKRRPSRAGMPRRCRAMHSHGATPMWKKRKGFLGATRGAMASRPTAMGSPSSSTTASIRASRRAASSPRTCSMPVPGNCKENHAMRLLLLLLLWVSIAANAQDFPSRTIRILLPFQAGGLLDVVAHVVADKFREKWSQPAVLEHRVGASGNIAAEALSKAPPDGHTLLLSPPGPIALNKLLYANLAYDSDAFVPLSILVSTPAVLVVNPEVPANNPQQLIAYAKANPGKLNY